LVEVYSVKTEVIWGRQELKHKRYGALDLKKIVDRGSGRFCCLFAVGCVGMSGFASSSRGGSNGPSWLVDRLLNSGEEAFSDGSMMNDVCSYVVTMSVDDGLNYLLALSGNEGSRPKLKTLLEEFHGGGSSSKTPSQHSAGSILWGEPPKDDAQAKAQHKAQHVASKPKKKRSQRGKTILSTSRSVEQPLALDRKTSSKKAAGQRPRGGDGRAPGTAGAGSEKRGSAYANCLLCGTVVWYNDERDKVCNSGLHPKCKKLAIDSVDARTGEIDPDYGNSKRMSSRNRKRKEEDIRTNPRTAGWVSGFEAAVEQKDRLCTFDRQQAARSMVFDDQNDYFRDSESAWLTKAEREVARRKAEAIREKKQVRRKGVSISFDLAGRRVTRIENSGDMDDEEETVLKETEGMAQLDFSGSDAFAGAGGPTYNSATPGSTGLCWNVLSGRAGKIYDRLQKAVLEEEKQSPAAAQDEGVDGKTAFPVDQTALRRVVGVDEGEVVL
jgi:hypothetical protein